MIVIETSFSGSDVMSNVVRYSDESKMLYWTDSRLDRITVQELAENGQVGRLKEEISLHYSKYVDLDLWALI